MLFNLSIITDLVNKMLKFRHSSQIIISQPEISVKDIILLFATLSEKYDQ